MRRDLLGRIGLFLFFLLLLGAPARAQFSAQQTYVGSSSGGSNAFIVVVPNVSQAADLVGVPIRVMMSASNSGAATLQVNSGGSTIIAATAINKLTTGGLTALTAQGGSEIVAGQINTYIWDGTVFELVQPNLFIGTVPAQSGFDTPVNLSLSCTAAANALTCQMLAANIAAAPTANNPVYVAFRDATIANGDPVWKTITSLISFTISGGNTMGCASGAPCRLWLFAANNAGTVQLCAYNAATPNSIVGINEGTLQSSGAGSGGGSSAQTIYCNAANLSGVAVRYIGYVEWTVLTTAGTWTSPNFVQLFGPGIARPGTPVGTVVQVGMTSPTTLGTPPTYVATGVTVTISPSSAVNGIEFSAAGTVNTGGANQSPQIAMFRGSTQVGPVSRVTDDTAGGSSPRTPMVIPTWIDFPGTTAATTYTVKGVGQNSSWPDGSSIGGVTNNACGFFREIQGANDNRSPFERIAKAA